MIHVDQNQHTAILSPHSTQNLILPREKQFRDWTESTSQKTGRKSPPSYPDTTFPGPTTPKDNQPIAANPEAPSTPASPADGNSASPTREHSSSSLSPVPDTAQSSPPPPTTNSPSNTGAAPAEPSTDDRESRQSTPLSELSPPPDDDDPPLDEKKDSGDSGVDAATKKEHQEDEVKLPEKSLPSPNPYPSRSSDYVPSPSISPNHSSSHSAGKDPKVATILELNSELFKILLELQARGVNPSDVRFQQFATRLQSNLNFLATAADRPSNQSAMTYPMMDAPPFIDILSTDRIQQLYVDLANVFQKSITRRPSLGPGLPNNNHIGFNHLKRERSDEPSLDMMAHKRRDTGEGKSSSNGMMMPPPSLTLQDQLSNGISTSPSPSTRSGSSPMPMPPQASTSAMSGMIPPAPGQGLSGTGSLPDAGMSEAQLNQAVREQQRMANMRAQQQRSGAMPGMPSTPQPQQGGRHMSPPSSSGVALSNPQISPTSSNHSGPSNIVPNGGGGLSSAQQIQQQAYAILQSQPPHPILQYMHRMVNNFGSLSYHDQARRIFQVLQMRQQQQQSVQHQMGGNGMPNGAFPNHSSPISPIAQQAQMNPMMLAGGQGMNSGSGAAMSGSVGGAGNSSGMNGGGNISMNQMTPNQRQQLMLMQQQRGGGIGSGGMNPMNNMNMNGLSPQQFAMLQQQRQQHSGQQGMSQNATSPTQQHHGGGGNGSPMIPGSDLNNFPALRSNNAIPGIARSARSPPDGGMGMSGLPGPGNQSPMTPRMPTRASMGQDDFTRMMGGGGGPSRGGMMPGSGSGNFTPQQMQNWQQQIAGGMGGGRPPSAHGGGYGGGGTSMGASSPPGSAGGGFGSGSSGGIGSSSYPFPTPSPGSGHPGDLSSSNLGIGGMPRHMSDTPGPGPQMRNPNMNMNGMNYMNNMNNMNSMSNMGMGMNMNSPTSADPFSFMSNDIDSLSWTQ